jgi:hypothetical protein
VNGPSIAPTFTPAERFAKCRCGKAVPTELVRKQGMFVDLGSGSENAAKRGAMPFDSFYCGCYD